jgi:predicted transcriptional regulator
MDGNGGKRLGRREGLVLACLWELGEATADEVSDRLVAVGALPRSEVSTTLVDLRRRGLLSSTRRDYRSVYRAAVQRDQVAIRWGSGIIARLVASAALGLVSRLLGPDQVRGGEVEGLQRLVCAAGSRGVQ